MARPPLRRLGPEDLAPLGDEELLDVQFRELDLKIEGSDLALRIEQLNGELASRGLLFRPHFWLSDEWFTPDGIPASRSLLSRASRVWQTRARADAGGRGRRSRSCMRILRHEAGHAIDNAFHLRAQAATARAVRRSASPTRNSTRPSRTRRASCCTSTRGTRRAIPTRTSPRRSRVWLTPDAQWRQRYQDWPALRKLEYIGSADAVAAGRTPR
jgi:hypothetical protein